MKVLFACCFCLMLSFSYAQKYVLPQGEYMDTTFNFHPDCSPPYTIFYYQVKAKYPDSSIMLLHQARDFMNKRKAQSTGAGYITFRFFIDCKGAMTRVRVMQTDEDYKTTHFSKDYVNDLYDYVRTLNKWPASLKIKDLENINYIAFISFKIKNGEIVNIIP